MGRTASIAAAWDLRRGSVELNGADGYDGVALYLRFWPVAVVFQVMEGGIL